MKRHFQFKTLIALTATSMALALFLSGCAGSLSSTHASTAPATPRKMILFVWDGLRPDSVTSANTPNLYEMSQKGVVFKKNHSTYPTFTMMNSSSFNTGDYPDKVGFYGNTVYLTGPTGTNSSGGAVDYKQPVFTEDWNVLLSLNSFYNNQLFLVKRLLQAAQDAGKTTAIVGKSGAAFMFDLDRQGYGIDENAVFPQSLAAELQSNGFALPKNTPVMWPSVKLASSNGDPTSRPSPIKLLDGVTTDPTIGVTSPHAASNRYMMDVYLRYILPKKNPELSVIWLRDPDTTEHNYGPGSKAYLDALANMDAMLGQLMSRLDSLGLAGNTDIIVVSDHGHNTVSGDLSLFPLRAISNNAVGAIDNANGFSVSGDVKLAQLLVDNGVVTTVYDGSGYSYDPVLSGIMASGTQVYPDQTDTTGAVTGVVGKKYTTRNFKAPVGPLPTGSVVIATNGGSDYLYVPSKDATTVNHIVTFLQQREEFGAIFVDDSYGSIPGTLQMSAVRLENTAKRNPDIIVSYNFDENAVVNGLKGIEYESMFANRGMHGSFSPIDVNNTLIAVGPDFKTAVTNATPSGNIDVAPTIAYVMGLSLPNTDGRVLYEALTNNAGVVVTAASTNPAIVSSATVTGLTFYLPTGVMNSGASIDAGKSTYSIDLSTSSVSDSTGKSVTYFDYAKAVRQ